MTEDIKIKTRALLESTPLKVAALNKLPLTLPEEGELYKTLLLRYRDIVISRGGEFELDENTESKAEKVVKWMKGSNKRGLLLSGTLGNGKTTMLKTLKSIFGPKAVLMRAMDVYDWYAQKGGFPEVIRKDEIFLLDDLGVEPAGFNNFGQVRYPLAELLTKRCDDDSVTIISTNLSLEKIEKIYGARLMDRMKGGFSLITYLAPSYRRK